MPDSTPEPPDKSFRIVAVREDGSIVSDGPMPESSSPPASRTAPSHEGPAASKPQSEPQIVSTDHADRKIPSPPRAEVSVIEKTMSLIDALQFFASDLSLLGPNGSLLLENEARAAYVKQFEGALVEFADLAASLAAHAPTELYRRALRRVADLLLGCRGPVPLTNLMGVSVPLRKLSNYLRRAAVESAASLDRQRSDSERPRSEHTHTVEQSREVMDSPPGAHEADVGDKPIPTTESRGANEEDDQTKDWPHTNVRALTLAKILRPEASAGAMLKETWDGRRNFYPEPTGKSKSHVQANVFDLSELIEATINASDVPLADRERIRREVELLKDERAPDATHS